RSSRRTRSTPFPYTTLFRSTGRSRVRPGAALEGVGRDQPQVPGEHQQRKQHEREGDADREGARELARILGAAAREMKQPEAEARSEEHTSELQSLAYLVCRL